MEEDNQEGIVTLFYDERFKPFLESSPLLACLQGLEKDLEFRCGTSVETQSLTIVKLKNTISNLREAIDYLLDSYGFPFKVARPVLSTEGLFDEHLQEEFREEERGYDLFKQLVKERGKELSFFGPIEEVVPKDYGRFSYILFD